MKKSILKRVLSMVLCLVLVASYLPAGILPAVAEGTNTVAVTKVADPSTKDSWQDYYGTGADITTDNAGGIWTDKSVFTDASAFSNITTDSQGNPVSITMENANDMLVALSAMGSNMTVTGQSSVPTDTMLVLDLSGSMNSSNNDVAEELAEAANTTIHTLLSNNPNNRVGVVLYSGPTSVNGSASANDAVVLLPLGRYTTGSDNVYVSYDSGSYWSNETIGIDSDVRVAGTNTKPSSVSKQVVGATYIQKGVILAMNQLTAASNQTAPSGITHKPILVLMSDGAPTVSDTDFTNPGSYDLGSGSGTSAAQGFVNQLSLAYAKAMIQEKYNTKPLFYTVGLGTTGDAVATSVLNPANSNSGINEFWRQYNAASVGGTVTVDGSGNWAKKVTKISTALDQKYVDKYIGVTANTNLAQGLKDAFDQVITEIEMQSKYFPTLVGSNHDLSGYVSFVDKIGTYLSVTDVKGILLHEQLHTGQNLAKNFVEDGGIFGTEANPTAAGTAMMESVRDRLGLPDDEAARSLIKNAYYYGQLSYNAQTGAYSNYIGWYADAQGNYMGFYQEGVTVLPADAVYTVKSYGFLGETHAEHGVLASDLMYATVQVRHHIATGEEEMQLKIPASLLPTITYEVTLDQNGNLEALTRTGATYPFRLLYEVGLDRHINNLNVTEYVSADYLATANSQGKPITLNSDGSVSFYTNKFDVDLNTGYGTNNAYSYFNPSHQNDKYYFQSNALIYADQNGTLYTGSTAPSAYNGSLYRQHISYEKIGGQLNKDVHYHELSAEAKGAALRTDGSNTWYVPEDTVYTFTTGYVLDKGNNNKTDTLPFAKLPFVDVSGHSVTDTDHSFTIGSTLGNNGKLTLMPETGMKLTKVLAAEAEGSSNRFTFTVSGNTANGQVVRLSESGIEISREALPANGQVTLTAGESVYIIGLTPGSYTVTENAHDDYSVSAVTVNGTAQNGTVATVTVAERAMPEVIFTNSPKGYGNLMITKEVRHASQGHMVPAAMLEQTFTVTVNVGADLAGKTFKTLSGTNEGSVTVGADGSFNATIKHGTTLEILGLPDGTVATVTETGVTAPFTFDYILTRDHTGADQYRDNTVTIGTDTNSTAVVHNVYTPDSVQADLDVEITKNFIIESALSSATFEFAVQYWNGQTWADRSTGSISYNGDSGQKAITLQDVLQNVTYTEAGDYAYRVIEVIPAEADKLPGVSYDRTEYNFTVRVTDVGGQLTASVIDDNEPVTGAYEAVFTNTYHTAPASLDVQKTLNITSGNAEVPKSGFLFEAYVANADFTLADETADLTVRSDATGRARFAATYNRTGTFYYVVREKDEGRTGWAYDKTEYHVTVVVTDDGTGDLRATVTTVKAGSAEPISGPLTFTNTYDPVDAKVDLNTAVRKDLIGRTPKAGEFTFALFENGKASHTSTTGALLTGTNAADGSVELGSLTFDKIGSYEYDIVEITGNKGGVSYSTRIYDLVVEVTDDSNGKLSATWYFEDETSGTATFRNTYTAAETSYTVTGSKQLTGKALINDEFTFILTETDANGTALQGGKVLQATNTMDGSFAFETITYTAPGVHYYVVSEKQEATTGGITFDQTTYTVCVTVTDNGVGQLIATATVNGDAAKTIGFVNHYVPAKTSGIIPGDKVLEGKVLGTGDYSFQLYNSNENWDNLGKRGDSVANGADGKFQFPEIEYTQAGTYYYLVDEVNGGQTIGGVTYDDSVFRVRVTVTDDLRGQLHAETVVFDQDGIPQIGVEFVNVYTVTGDASLVLEGSKQLTDKTMTGGEFTFELYAANDQYVPSGEPIAAGTNSGSGQFSVRVNYTAEADLGKTYYYVLQEKNKGQLIDGITYDSTAYRIMVVVKDDSQGGIELDVTAVGAQSSTNKVTTVTGLNFKNTYHLESTTVKLEGSKTLTGMRELKANDFTFQLYKTAADFIATGITPIETKNGGTGNKQFTFADQTLDSAGEHYFVIKESNANPLGGVAYDDAEYRVTVKAEDNKKGKLEVTSITYKKVTSTGTSTVGSVEFTNKYDPADATVTLKGTKNLSGKILTADMFTFQLYKTAADFVTTGITPTESKNAANGDYSFTLPAFDAEGTHYYVVKELNAGNKVEGTTYDAKEYRFTVKIEDNENGQLIPTVTAHEGGSVAVSGTVATVTGLNFTNNYKADSCFVSFSGTKTLDGIRPLKADDFTFQLYKTGSDFATAGITPVETKNGGTGNKQFTFADQTLDSAGKHYFVIKESTANSIGGVDYDPAEYRITVNVTDEGNGKLKAQITSQVKVTAAGSESAQEIAFTNKYTAQEATVDISGKKSIDTRPLKDGEKFTFLLQETDSSYTALTGSVPQEKQNAQDGAFAFDQLRFSLPGTYYYTVTEKDAGEKINGVTYDETVYKIKVVVTDNEAGKLIPTVTVDNSQAKVSVSGTAAAVTDVKFLNTYAAAATLPVSMTGSKTVDGQWTLKAGDFSFQLFKADSQYTIQGSALQTVSNAASGAFQFQNITFETAGTHYLVIKESSLNPINGMTYDEAVYRMSVVVTDNLLGQLEITGATLRKVTAEGTSDATELTFLNSYDAEDATLSLSGKKVLEGKALSAGEFTFTLQQTDAQFAPLTGTLPKQAVNAGDGSFTFDAITYDATGTYYYTVTEADTGNERTTFDKTVYRVTVTVTDENGVLKAVASYATENASAEELVFTNVYTPKPADLPVVFTVNKTVKNTGKDSIGPEGFTFVLEESADAKIEAVTDKDGKASFHLNVTEDMVGEVYKLKLYEKNDGKANVTYSTAVYEITVSVSLGSDNKLVADLTVDGKAVEDVCVAFENIYNYTPSTTPYTGDSTHVTLLFSLLGISALAMAAAVIFRKKLLK